MNVLVRFVVICASAVFALSGCGGGGSDDGRGLEWAVFTQVGPREVKLVGNVEYCLGAPEPRIASAKVKYSNDHVLIKLTLAAPPAMALTDKCRGVGRAVYTTVTLKRTLKSVALFDASTDPPERRWPD